MEKKSGRGPGLGEIPKSWGSSLIFLQRRNMAASRLAAWWAFPRPIIKSHAEEKWAWPWSRELPKFLKFPFDISATAEASDLNSVCNLGLPNPIIKLHPEKNGRDPELEELSTIGGFPLIFLQRLKGATSKLAGWCALPKPTTKSHREEKEGVALG